MQQELLELVKKKAFGFSYTEETVEYETRVAKPYLFCSSHNRLYHGVGYIKVKPIFVRGEIGGLRPIKQKIKFACGQKNWGKFKKS